jgi:hypothetical protein
MRSVRIRAERLAADDFNDAAEDVGGAAVVPFRAGLAEQRQARDHHRMFGIGDLAAAQPRLLIELLHQAVAGVVVGDARSVAQQDPAPSSAACNGTSSSLPLFSTPTFVGEFRNELCDRVGEQEVAVLDQHHDADRDDRLVIEKMRKMVSWAIGADAAGDCPRSRRTSRSGRGGPPSR